ncbi:TetR/AcrR family transcriptional regulator [Streptomyces parvulus]|uniref:TetR/AcrR family transcriptional regulator n=1 Tax=Streptomyces parvulus TaxID=146923 RepID=UPI0033C10A67
MGTRRHGTALVRAIHEAALAEVAEHGYAGTTYDGVAARAGTSKPVLYRRWPTKAQMILDALMSAHPGPPAPRDTGSLPGDLKAFLRDMQTSLESCGRQTMLSLLAEVDPVAGSAVRDLLFARGAEILQPMVERARRRGELGDADLPARVVTLPLDLVRHEITLVGTLSDNTLDTIVNQITLPLYTGHSHALPTAQAT